MRRGDQESGQAAIDWLIDCKDRQRAIPGEVARAVRAADFEVTGADIVGRALEGVWREGGAAPWACLDRRGRPHLLGIVPVLAHARDGCVVARVALATKSVR